MFIEISDEQYEEQVKASPRITEGDFLVEVIDIPKMDLTASRKLITKVKMAVVDTGRETNLTLFMEDKEGKIITWPVTKFLDAIGVPWKKVAGGIDYNEVECLGKVGMGVFRVSKNKPTYTGKDGNEYPNIQLQSVKDKDAKHANIKIDGVVQELPF